MKDPEAIQFINNDEEKVAIICFEQGCNYISIRMKNDLNKEIFTIEIPDSEAKQAQISITKYTKGSGDRNEVIFMTFANLNEWEKDGKDIIKCITTVITNKD